MARKPKTLPIHTSPEPPRPTHPEQIEEQALGRNLAAFIATRLGIGLDYARKRHAHEPVGEFWLSVARTVVDQIAQYGAPPVRRGGRFGVQ